MSEEDKLKTNNEKVTINDYYYYYLLKCEDALNELEKWIKENNLGKYRTENVVDTDELLDKLKALKKEDEETRLNNIINRIDNFADRAIEVIKQRL